MYCQHCGAFLPENTRFCTACGAQIQEARQPTEANHTGIDPGQETSGPLRFIKASVHVTMDSVRMLLRNPKKLIPVLVLSGFWLILSLLSSLGVNPGALQFLSFLTFAQGGMYSGILGAVGGIIGKAVFAYFVTALVFPIFTKKKPQKNTGKRLKGFFSGLAVKGANEAGHVVFGIGLALVVFNFLTGNASTVNSMAGVVGLVLGVRAIWRRTGFFWGFLLSVANKLVNGRVSMQTTVCRLLSGYAVGSIAGIALSPLRVSYLPYALGALLLIAGVVLGICFKAQTKKEAAL